MSVFLFCFLLDCLIISVCLKNMNYSAAVRPQQYSFFITVILRVSSLLCKVCINNMNTVWKPAETQLALWLERLTPDQEDMRWNLQCGPTRRTS